MFLTVPKGRPAHMDVETAGALPVAAIAHADGLAQHVCPRHFFPVIVQGHGMGNDLKAVSKGAVVLAVDVLVVSVGDVHNGVGVAVILARPVDLQLYAQIAGRCTIEDGGGFAVIILNTSFLMVAVVAIGVFTVLIALIKVGIILVDDAVAAGAGGVVVVPAGFAERRVGVSGVIVPPDGLPAVGAGQGVGLGTGGAELLIINVVHDLGWVEFPTDGAGDKGGWIGLHGSTSLTKRCPAAQRTAGVVKEMISNHEPIFFLSGCFVLRSVFLVPCSAFQYYPIYSPEISSVFYPCYPP